MRWTLGMVLAAASLLAATPAATAADLLPDLGMKPATDLRTEKRAGRLLLRYTSVVVNVGSGVFEVHGRRATISDPQMTGQQWIYDDAGGSRPVSTGTVMVFGGDGHNHWHVLDLESAELIRLDNGSKVGTSAKRGFCFFDNSPYRLSLPGAPQAAVYKGCGTSSSLAVAMGLSIGWGDAYYWSLPDQYIDITGLAAGRYRLRLTADAQNRFVESNNSNNATWVDLRLKGNGRATVVGSGPAP